MASRCSQVSVTRAEIEFDRNPPRSVRRKRTKKSTVGVRHLCPNLGTDGAVRLAALRASSALPTQITFSSTFPGIHRYLWRVDWFPIEPKGSLGKLLATAIGSYPTFTDRNRVLRLMGFANCKNDPAYHVTVEYRGDSAWDSDDFWLDIPDADAVLSSRTFTARKHPSNPTNPEHDWSWVLPALAHGKDAAKLTRKLASRRADKPNSLYYAQRTAEVASARLWLVESVPIDDVVTLLEVRRHVELPLALCRARAWQPAPSVRGRRRCDPAFNFVTEQERCFAPEEL
jgi:RepB DNA-primase N-terminal domain